MCWTSKSERDVLEPSQGISLNYTILHAILNRLVSFCYYDKSTGGSLEPVMRSRTKLQAENRAACEIRKRGTIQDIATMIAYPACTVANKAYVSDRFPPDILRNKVQTTFKSDAISENRTIFNCLQRLSLSKYAFTSQSHHLSTITSKLTRRISKTRDRATARANEVSSLWTYE